MAFIVAIVAFFFECRAVCVGMCIATSLTGDLGDC